MTFYKEKHRITPYFLRYLHVISTFLYVISLLFSFTNTCYSQPLQLSPEEDRTIAKMWLIYRSEGDLNFTQRVNISNKIIDRSSYTVRAKVVHVDYIQKDNILYSKITLAPNHFYRGGDKDSFLNDITILRKVKADEDVVLEDGKIRFLRLLHSYGLCVYKSYEYIFFCHKEDSHLTFTVQNQMTFLLLNSGSGVGLCGMMYKNIDSINNHLSEFENIILPED